MTHTTSTGTQLLEKILIQLEHQTDELDSICARLESMNSTLSVGRESSNGSSDDGKLVEFDATEIVTTFDDTGTRKLFRIKGGQYSTYGIRVWDEVLQQFGYDPVELEPGSTPFTERVVARVGVHGKQKIIGLAGGGV